MKRVLFRDPTSTAWASLGVIGRFVRCREYGPNGRLLDKRDVAMSEFEALQRAYVARGWVIDARRSRGMTWIDAGGVASFYVEEPSSMPPVFSVSAELSAGLTRMVAHSGRRSSLLLVDLPLWFAEPAALASVIRDFAHWSDWEGRHGWPAGLVPLAVPQPDTPEDDARVMAANPSDCEQFFAVTDARPFPVHLWSVDAGVEQVAESLSAFAASL